MNNKESIKLDRTALLDEVNEIQVYYVILHKAAAKYEWNICLEMIRQKSRKGAAAVTSIFFFKICHNEEKSDRWMKTFSTKRNKLLI